LPSSLSLSLPARCPWADTLNGSSPPSAAAGVLQPKLHTHTNKLTTCWCPRPRAQDNTIALSAPPPLHLNTAQPVVQAPASVLRLNPEPLASSRAARSGCLNLRTQGTPNDDDVFVDSSGEKILSQTLPAGRGWALHDAGFSIATLLHCAFGVSLSLSQKNQSSSLGDHPISEIPHLPISPSTSSPAVHLIFNLRFPWNSRHQCSARLFVQKQYL